MTLDAVIMLVGAIVAILPFLGFPSSWDSVLYFILGVIVIALGIVVRRRSAHTTSDAKRVSAKDTYVEAVPSSRDIT
ncbi:hypothetical protein FJY93_00525 [Candidatus Kaiserbacteria bacterium]|nr:hypothetical protein [Candidatus Kaiserbacteria bacterium]